MAIARVVIRSKEQLVAVRPIGDALGMATMLFADEVLSPERLDEIAEARRSRRPSASSTSPTQLVDSLAGDFEPDRFRDTYREQVLELIERKARARQSPCSPRPRRRCPGARPDERLKASLDAVRAREDAAEAQATAAPRKPRKAAEESARPRKPQPKKPRPRRPPPRKSPPPSGRPGRSRPGGAVAREGPRIDVVRARRRVDVSRVHEGRIAMAIQRRRTTTTGPQVTAQRDPPLPA